VHGSGTRFFRSVSSNIIDNYFDVAYFFKMSPDVVLAMSLSEFERFESQALRIADKLLGES
jgi:hypothetical protein